jgi:di/tricarboxylate transporter
MSLEMIIVLIVITGAILLFAFEKMPVDLTAITVMAVLLLTGIITAEEGISGFSNPATITVGAMFIISAALTKSGALVYVGTLASRLFKFGFVPAMIIMMISASLFSAFINNTPIVAVFIPIMLKIAYENNISPSKLLMPLSFASIFGGVCTLIGTSTNILVSSIAVQYGEPAISMFELSPLGLVFFVIGILYMIFLGIKLIPARSNQKDLTQKFKLNDYLTDIVILPEAASVGKRLIESPLVKELDIDVLYVIRNGERLLRPLSTIILQPNDVLRVRCDIEEIRKIQERVGVVLKSNLKLKEKDIAVDDIMVVEAIVAPNSMLIGKSLKSANFRNKFRATALALRHRGELYQEGFASTLLSPGDALLIEVRKENFEELRKNNNFVLVYDVKMPKYRTSKIIPTLLIIAGIVTTATIGLMPIMVSAVIGCVFLILIGAINLEEAYRAIEWKVIFLLGGILSLGIAMEKTGTAMLISSFFIEHLSVFGPIALVAAFYLTTSLLTEIMSNNATAVLLTPIAINAAHTLGVDPRPFIIAIAFAASASFMTPVGYQTNTMIYGVGQYKFSDFIKVGGPLNLIFWLIASLLIPIFFPF